jgi:hypothetical protein
VRAIQSRSCCSRQPCALVSEVRTERPRSVYVRGERKALRYSTTLHAQHNVHTSFQRTMLPAGLPARTTTPDNTTLVCALLVLEAAGAYRCRAAATDSTSPRLSTTAAKPSWGVVDSPSTGRHLVVLLLSSVGGASLIAVRFSLALSSWDTRCRSSRHDTPDGTSVLHRGGKADIGVAVSGIRVSQSALPLILYDWTTARSHWGTQNGRW